MNEFIRKAVLFGIGSVYYSKEKIEEFVKELQEDEGLNPAEGKKMVDEVMEKADAFRKEQEKQIEQVVKNAIDRLGIATEKTVKKGKIKKMVKKAAKKAVKKEVKKQAKK